MAICSKCSTAIQRLHPQDRSPRKGDVNIKLPVSCRAAVCGCWVCFKFSKWLEAGNTKLFREWRRRSLPVKFGAFGRMHFEEPKQDVLLPLFMEISPSGQEEDGATCAIELNFMSATEFLTYKRTAPKNHATAGIDLSAVDHWIGTCTRDHKGCRENGPLWYPSRLLHLGLKGQEVKLIISKDDPPEGPYMTLSYRWGCQQYTKLVASTMAQLQRVIDVASLPQIFQDTITIAHHIGVKYLWIDGLCILQDKDNTSDWKNESLNMDKIYSYAFLNVSATLSLDGSESLFKERPLGPFLHSEIELEVNGLLQKYYVHDGDLWHDEIINAPVNRRGWVFQERFLARRVLHFGERQMGWECRELEALDMFPAGLPRASVTSSTSKSKVVSMMATLTQQSGQAQDLIFTDLWQNLVTQYSKCELSYSKDKLIAFAGVAKCMMEARTDHYAAGMWEKSMVYDLAWWRLSEDRQAFPIGKTSMRAPSWSWASVDGEITFPSTFGGVRYHFINVLDSSEPITNESCAFTVAESIRIKGHCLVLSIECSIEGIVGFKVAGFRFPVTDGAQGSSIDLEISQEELLELVKRGKVLILPLFATSYHLYGIVLAKIRGICAHRRLGAVEIPIMVRKVPDEMGEVDEPNSGSGRSQLGEWVRPKSTIQSDSMNTLWSIAAFGLLNHLLKPPDGSRTINIY